MTTKLETVKKKLKIAQQKCRRMAKKIQTIEEMVEELKLKNLVSENCGDWFIDNYGDVPKQLFERMTSNKKEPYSTELKTFAMTLQFYSPKAYKYVREIFNNALPNPRTIRDWYRQIDGEPGFTQPAFDALCVRVQEERDKNRKVVCALLLMKWRFGDMLNIQTENSMAMLTWVLALFRILFRLQKMLLS
jgi:hypothetical protein